jgi:Zn-dependent metalloprotease
MKKLQILITMLLLTTAKIYSQDYIPYFLQEDNSFIRSRADMVHLNGWVVFNDTVNIPTGGMINLYKNELGFNSSDSLALKSTFEDNFPFTNVNNKYKHLKYQQYFNGIKVEYAEFMEHSIDNKVHILNGKVVNGLSISTIPTIPLTTAINNAINHYGTTNDYAWTHPDLEQEARLDLGDSNATNYPKGELVLAYTGVGNNLYPEHYKLAWCMRVRSIVPSFDKNIYIDAQTGLVLKEADNRHYDGWADLSIHGLGNKWIDTRWRGFPHYDFVLNANNGRNIETKQHVFVGWGLSSHYNDNDDSWPSSDWKFTIPHWAVNNAYDYFSSTFNRVGCDVANGIIRIRANSGEATHHNEHNGIDWLTFGSDQNEYRASVDICAHEYTHGIGTQFANLFGSGESGAIEESFADIFGIMAEYYSQGNVNNDWKIGEDAGQYRDLQNPHNSTKIQVLNGVSSTAQPKFYHGQHWYYGNDDYKGVHVNNGVQNHWFYLLSNGGSVNNINYPGIGMDVASIITYVNYTNFLGQFSNYTDAAIGSVLAAEIFFGNCSQPYNSTWNAWAQVGLAVPISTSGISIVGQTLILTNPPYNYTYPVILTANTYNNQNCTWNYPAQWSCQVGGPNNSNLIINDFNNYYSTSAVSVSTLPCNFTSTHNFNFSDGTGSGNTNDPIGRKRFSQGEIVLSPVPTSSNLNIHVESTTYDPATKWNIKVLNFYGIAQFSNNSWTTLPTSINVSNLYAGTYMLQLISNRETVVIPFQKN